MAKINKLLEERIELADYEKVFGKLPGTLRKHTSAKDQSGLQGSAQEDESDSVSSSSEDEPDDSDELPTGCKATGKNAGDAPLS